MIENWSLTETSLSFNLSGSATLGSAPAVAATALFIGSPGDPDWITGDDSGTLSGTADSITTGANLITNYSDGGFIDLGFASSLDFTDGGTVSVNFSYTGSSIFVPGNLNENDLIVTWGYNSSDTLPDVSTQIGSFSAVPETSTFASLAGLLAFCFAATRRWRAQGWKTHTA